MTESRIEAAYSSAGICVEPMKSHILLAKITGFLIAVESSGLSYTQDQLLEAIIKYYEDAAK